MTETTENRIVPRLQTLYNERVRPALQKEFNYTNVMQVPKLEKIVINMGVGEAPATRRSSTRRLPT